MKFSLILLGDPYSTQSPATAYRFAKAALKAGHSVYRVFFYHEAVRCSTPNIPSSNDEHNIPELWSELAGQHSIDLVVCVASALKRGVSNRKDFHDSDTIVHSDLTNHFKLSGLGQLIDATLLSDRLITFGS